MWSGELEPGTYTVETIVEEGVLVAPTLELQPFGPIQTAGHVVLTLLLIVVAWGEQGLRALLARRKPKHNIRNEGKNTVQSGKILSRRRPFDLE